MSKEAVEAVIGKVVLDAEFRQLLSADPEKALAGFDLSEFEKAGLMNMDGETMEVLANTLDARLARWSGIVRK